MDIPKQTFYDSAHQQISDNWLYFLGARKPRQHNKACEAARSQQQEMEEGN